MDDRDIVALYLNRDPDAVKETALKYGGYCGSIARNLLGSSEDAEECVNDAYLHAWNSIPPHRPEALSTYLGKLTRNLCFDRSRHRSAEKRGGGQLEQVLEELAECVPGEDSVEAEVDARELAREVDRFLDTLPREKRTLFLCRYWYACSVPDLAERFGMTENNVSVTLNRVRGKLKTYLTKRGYDL